MSMAQFDEWLHHYEAEPFGYQVDAHRHAETCVALYNGLIPKKEGVYEYADFVNEPTSDDPDEDMDWREMKAMLTARFGDNNVEK